jgi:hypothetical protein
MQAVDAQNQWQPCKPGDGIGQREKDAEPFMLPSGSIDFAGVRGCPGDKATSPLFAASDNERCSRHPHKMSAIVARPPKLLRRFSFTSKWGFNINSRISMLGRLLALWHA